MTARDLLRRWTRLAAEPVPASAESAVEAAGRTHVGKVRQINEDRFLVYSERGLWAVADGMGGHSAGGEAAQAAIDELRRLADGSGAISAKAIHAALAAANRRIRDNSRAPGAVSGTTIVVAWLSGDRLTVFWAGDSRAYLLREGASRCLTRDHSLVQELVDAGAITDAEAERHPKAHLVSRALGAFDTVVADQVAVDLKAGDRLLLCSDGVSRSLDLASIPGDGQSIGQLADALLGRAISCDGSDNATLIAIAPTLP